MLAVPWVVLTEECLRPSFETDRLAATRPPFPPFAHLEDEVEVVHELVVDDVVVAAVLPQEIGPPAVDLLPELARAPGVGDGLAKVGLELLKAVSGFPREFILR